MQNMSYVLFILTIFASALLNPNLMLSAKGQEGDAYFTSIEYPKSHLYQYNKDFWNFSLRPIVYNKNCAVDDLGQAWFF